MESRTRSILYIINSVLSLAAAGLAAYLNLTVLGTPFNMGEDFTIHYLPITMELALLTAYLAYLFWKLCRNQFSKAGLMFMEARE